MSLEHPKYLYEKMEENFHSIEQFDQLVQSASHYYQENGPLDMLKIFIPNGTSKEFSLLHDWTPEKSELAADAVIDFFSEKFIANSYFKEIQEDGIYIAFTTETFYFLPFTQYIFKGECILDSGKENGIILTAHEWLRDFPYAFHSSFYNRIQINEKISLHIREPEYKLLAQTLYDGQQNWLENNKHLKIDNWIPPNESNFTYIYTWKYKDTPEEKENGLLNFKEKYS